MFTGIIESVGTITTIRDEGTNRHFRVGSSISNQLRVDQSLSHDGVCLTVVSVGADFHWVVAIKETLERSTAGDWQEGSLVNLERSMIANGRFDGHVVQGHVDQQAKCMALRDEHGSWVYDFEYDVSSGHVNVEKGSIAINGVSLTVFNIRENRFSVAIIPYTFEHTSFSRIKPGTMVNLEFDIIGKYVKKIMNR